MNRLALIAASSLLLAGCFRITDPVYTFRSLGVEEPEAPGNALLFGSLEITGAFSRIDTIILRRVSPWRDDKRFAIATEKKIYRVFRTRSMKDGHFLLQVAPGVYEVDALLGGMWGQEASFIATDDTRAASRLVVTRAGIYDLGRLKLDAGPFTITPMLSWEGRGGADRAEILKRAVTGTGWKRFLPVGG